jgi:hypothetical protein
MLDFLEAHKGRNRLIPMFLPGIDLKIIAVKLIEQRHHLPAAPLTLRS